VTRGPRPSGRVRGAWELARARRVLPARGRTSLARASPAGAAPRLARPRAVGQLRGIPQMQYSRRM